MKVLIIVGPTATGKTGLAETLAIKFNGELISADSRQVYRGMNLSTGKEYTRVPVWLYDVANPDEEFSVSHWAELAARAISDIHARGKLPIIVGGTGLYVRALLTTMETITIPPDPELRKRLGALTVKELQAMVTRGSMNDSDWNNPRRLIRKIEIAKADTAGKRVKNDAFLAHSDTFIVGLTAPLPVLDRRIDERLTIRRKAGMDGEVEALRMKYDGKLPSMSAIGVNEHAYARRQLTWFRKQPGIVWFDVSEEGALGKVEKTVGEWYTSL